MRATRTGSSPAPHDGQPAPVLPDLHALVTGLLATTTVEEVGAVVAATAGGPVGASFANLVVYNAEAARARVLTFDPVLPPAVTDRWADFPISTPAPLSDAIVSGRPVFVGSAHEMRERYPFVVADALGAAQVAMAALPLIGERGVIGALTVTWAEAQEFSDGQAATLLEVSRLVAAALERALRQRSGSRPSLLSRQVAAELLQRAVLPAELPHAPDLDVAAGYLPANDAAIGGDWYDVFPVGDRTCLVVGDIAGHGVHGVATMAQVRNAVRAYAVEDPSPGRVLTRVNHLLCELGSGTTASAVVVVWDPSIKTLVRANAGHPPVLRCRPGEFGYLDPPTDVILGVVDGWQYAERVKVLRPGTTIVMYTDGVVEIPPAPLDAGMAELLTTVEALADLSPRAVCDCIMQWRKRAGRRNDDVCVLAARLA
jgi:serine phosphatase RsbU (regulator of sigma subunit)